MDKDTLTMLAIGAALGIGAAWWWHRRQAAAAAAGGNFNHPLPMHGGIVSGDMRARVGGPGSDNRRPWEAAAAGHGDLKNF